MKHVPSLIVAQWRIQSDINIESLSNFFFAYTSLEKYLLKIYLYKKKLGIHLSLQKTYTAFLSTPIPHLPNNNFVVLL